MASRVNLDALIPRADFFETTSPAVADTPAIRITDLEPGITYSMLRKPDFQRETVDWSPNQVIRLIDTFCRSDIIPAVILWQSGSQLFVLDGAHRLSALIAWINNDYGAGKLSQNFFRHQIPEQQKQLHEQTAALIDATIGSWADYKSKNPVINLKDVRVQWVKDYTAEQAAEAFIRINQGGTVIDPLEERILRAKRSALAVATRVIARGGTGHEYWKHFENDTARSNVPKLGREVYDLLFQPPLQSPIKSTEIPLAGSGYGPGVIRLAFDLVGLANDLQVPDSSRSRTILDDLPDDNAGTLTERYLRATKRLAQLMLSTHPSSLGLHPALYCYTSRGTFQSAALLNVAAWVHDLRRTNRLDCFRRIRGVFEELLMAHPEVITPETHKLGSGTRSRSRMLEVLNHALDRLTDNTDIDQAWESLKFNFSDRIDDEQRPEEGQKPGARFSRRTKSAIFLADLPLATKCELCGGLLHRNGMVLDHRKRRADGGTATRADGRWVHPICNSNRQKDEAG